MKILLHEDNPHRIKPNDTHYHCPENAPFFLPGFHGMLRIKVEADPNSPNSGEGTERLQKDKPGSKEPPQPPVQVYLAAAQRRRCRAQSPLSGLRQNHLKLSYILVNK